MRFRPANPIFDGVITPFARGTVKNLNPRKGTETHCLPAASALLWASVKNHNPRKGTETLPGPAYTNFPLFPLRTLIPEGGRRLLVTI